MNFLGDVERILKSPATTLEALADVVGLTVEELFEGESFAGVDLREEPIEVLLRIDADFEDAILSSRQKSALRESRGKRAERVRRRRFDIVREARRDRIEEFIRYHFISRYYSAAEKALLQPLMVYRERPLKWDPTDLPYASDALSFIISHSDALKRTTREAVLRFLIHLKYMQFPLDAGVTSVLADGVVKLDPSTVREVIDFDFCTKGFVESWLDSLATSSRSVYFEGLVVAIQGPRKPPLSYYDTILDRSDSFEEMCSLISSIPSRRLDAEVIRHLAVRLGYSATNVNMIIQAASNDNIDQRIRARFRSLIIAAGVPESTKALLSIISESGDKTGGLEVDAIMSGLNFDESVALIRLLWQKLSAHHCRVALDAIALKATNNQQRSQATRLRINFENRVRDFGS